jgi:peptide-methionine (S)-S-oxide reductase
MKTLKQWTVLITFAACFGLAASAWAQSRAAAPAATAKATFAGGCFWCMEPPYDKLPGVVSTTSGYMGGRTRNPTYESVSTGSTGHTEVVQVEYDPSKVSYSTLLEVFWRNIDPTQRDGQFCDHGSQYRTGIFYHNEEQKKLAEGSRAALQKNKPFKGDIVTEVTKAPEFYPAEAYHQDFYKKNPTRYKIYRNGCGRDARLQALWGRAGD